MISCRSCNQVFQLDKTQRVLPAFRYCNVCFDKMKEIGQVVPDLESDTGLMKLAWEGEPFGRRATNGIPMNMQHDTLGF